MNPTTVLRGILQKLKMTITRSLEANFLTELAANFFPWLKVCFVALGFHDETFQTAVSFTITFKTLDKSKMEVGVFKLGAITK